MEEQHAEYERERYHRRRAEAIARLGGRCVRCDTDENLEFDHRDRNDKSFSISKLWSVSQVRFEAELAKCQLLCNPCHKIKTREEMNDGPGRRRHGTFSMRWREGCTCPECLAYDRARRKRSGVV
jgi:5-methylcytosine-specific restriction endonuclease McrA